MLNSAEELSGGVPFQQQISWNTYLALAASLLTLAYLAILKACFNTYHLPRAIREERSRNKLESAYKSLFERREEVLYHINWTKSRGTSSEEREELARLADKVKELDRQIDEVEEKIVAAYNEQGVAPRSWVKTDKGD